MGCQELPFQVGGVFFIVLCLLVWIIQFVALGLTTANLPAVVEPTIDNYASIVPTVYAHTAPSIA